MRLFRCRHSVRGKREKTSRLNSLWVCGPVHCRICSPRTAEKTAGHFSSAILSMPLSRFLSVLLSTFLFLCEMHRNSNVGPRCSGKPHCYFCFIYMAFALCGFICMPIINCCCGTNIKQLSNLLYLWGYKIGFIVFWKMFSGVHPLYLQVLTVFDKMNFPIKTYMLKATV